MPHNISIDPGQVILVTAGASGIGRTIAETFLSHAGRVHVCDIDSSAIDDFLDANPGASASVADVSDPAMVDALFADVEERHGALDVLINNAGIAGPTQLLEDIEPADWNRTLAVNLNGHFYCARRAIPLLKRSAGGSIIGISSSAGLFGCPSRAPYAASKWALIGLTKTLAMELGPFGIRVNAICPGSVEGKRIEQVIEREAREQGRTPDEIRNAYLRQTSMRRFIDAQDVANMALFLASDSGKSISGQAIGVDGHTESLSNVTT
jgi:NAD(P)-dependent dehydrogenase (short-subunit alcohol dehydrogenase family)